MINLGLVHVVYAPYGLQLLQRFIASYRRHPAGIPHELILVCKAFAADKLPPEYSATLDGLAHRALFTPDGGFDLGSYFFAAKVCTHPFLCFLNSSSEILADNWLANLRKALDEPGVGIAGATGSHESHSTMLRRHAKPSPYTFAPLRLVRSLRRRWHTSQAERRFAPFPNPHLRTNAFLLERRILLKTKAGPFRDKEDCHRFESSRHGLTASLLRSGLQARVVDRCGYAWPPGQWRESHTFRAGEQENLLIADNRTRDYQEADDAGRRLLAQYAWG